MHKYNPIVQHTGLSPHTALSDTVHRTAQQDGTVRELPFQGSIKAAHTCVFYITLQAGLSWQRQAAASDESLICKRKESIGNSKHHQRITPSNCLNPSLVLISQLLRLTAAHDWHTKDINLPLHNLVANGPQSCCDTSACLAQCKTCKWAWMWDVEHNTPCSLPCTEKSLAAARTHLDLIVCQHGGIRQVHSTEGGAVPAQQ